MASEKTTVIESLFTMYWDESAGSLTKAVMSLGDVAQAIRDCRKDYGLKLSDRNPANFMKDILRRDQRLGVLAGVGSKEALYRRTANGGRRML